MDPVEGSSPAPKECLHRDLQRDSALALGSWKRLSQRVLLDTEKLQRDALAFQERHIVFEFDGVLALDPPRAPPRAAAASPAGVAASDPETAGAAADSDDGQEGSGKEEEDSEEGSRRKGYGGG